MTTDNFDGLIGEGRLVSSGALKGYQPVIVSDDPELIALEVLCENSAGEEAWHLEGLYDKTQWSPVLYKRPGEAVIYARAEITRRQLLL